MATRPPVPVHYVRQNESEWSPTHVAFFDTETTPIEKGDDELHLLRLWAGTAVRRSTPHTRQHAHASADGRTGAELADWIESQTVGHPSLWLYAHNLSFDLTSTRLLDHLSARGWTVTGFGTSDRCPWFRLRRRSKRLVITDSWSWLPDALGAIGRKVGVEKPDLPDWDDTDTAWLERCRGDVAVTAAAILSLMDWWDANKLGRWSVTGAATGWNAMRHRTVPRSVIIHPTDQARAFERSAIMGGRRDVWVTGILHGGPWADLDMTRAHATIAESELLPSRRLKRFRRLDLDDKIWTNPFMGAIADCRVRTPVPRYGCRIDNRIWWPTGEFWTRLAWPEMQMARQLGDLVEVGAGWRYALGSHMQTWARWVNGVASGETPNSPPAAQIAAKAWGRSVIGKWAGHKSETRRLGDATHPSWWVEKATTAENGSRARVVTLGDSDWWVSMDLDSDDSFPAVLAFVESHVRVRMREIITALGPEIVVACDTDGVIIDTSAARWRWVLPTPAANDGGNAESIARMVAGDLEAMIHPVKMQVKEVFDEVVITGPTQLHVDRQRRWAGVPTTAKSIPEGGWVDHVWPRLFWQMAHGDDDGYVRKRTRWSRDACYVHRWVLSDGSTIPTQAEIVDGTTTSLVPWPRMHTWTPGRNLMPEQHRDLAGLREDTGGETDGVPRILHSVLRSRSRVRATGRAQRSA